MREQAARRSDFKHFHAITTRWMDNDAYGHVNNVIYYSWFDTIVNEFLIANKALDIEHSQEIGLVIETRCSYFAPVSFPDRITAGVRVTKLGNSSVRYEIAIFREDEESASAQGHFVHVYVDRTTRKSAHIPEKIRSLLQSISVDE